MGVGGGGHSKQKNIQGLLKEHGKKGKLPQSLQLTYVPPFRQHEVEVRFTTYQWH